MTQETNPSLLPEGQPSSDTAEPKAKKNGTTTRKTPVKTAGAAKTGTAAKAGTAGTKKAAAKSAPKAAATKPETKPAAKKTVKSAAGATKSKLEEKPAKTSTAKTSAAKTKASKPAPTSAPISVDMEKPKAAAKPRRTVKPKTTAAEKKPDAAEPTPRETAPEEAPPVAEKETEKTGTTRQPKKKAEAPAVKQDETPADKQAEAVLETPVLPPETAQPVDTEEQRAEQAEASGQEGASKSSSRRSRRGGRRRNKNRTANGAQNGQFAVAAQSDSESIQLELMESDLVGDGILGSESVAPESAVSGSAQSETEAVVSSKAEGKKAPVVEQKAEAKPQDKHKKQGKDQAARAETGTEDADSDRDARAKPVPAKGGGKRKMFISVLSGELVEVVLAEEGHVVEYYVEMQHQAKVKGNIYKGVVSNIDANLQAAFISYAGGVKNGFLQIDEVHPEYYLTHHDPVKGRKYPPIQKVLKAGQEILVQVVKEPSGTKGAFLTSYLSLPGRFLVLTPGREQIGVSRKVDSDEERTRLRAMLEGITPGKGLGVIVRTVSEGASKTSLQRDLQFLKRLWKEVRTKGQEQTAPSLVYEELDLATRAVRDYLTDDVQEVWVDDAVTARQVTELASLLFPKEQNLVQVQLDNGQSLFERFNLQKQLDQIHSREVSLPSGGRLVIDNTEALTAIDINSGRSSGKSNFEDMAFRTNLEAAKAIPLQLRLRDIGGQVVVDFIEMRDRDHWREVEKAVRTGMKGDRARYDVGKIGPFGLLEIVRQRLGSSAISVSTEPCPCCKGTGIRRNMEWQAMRSLRDIARQVRHAAANNHPSLTYETEAELAFFLLNTKRTALRSLEDEAGVHVIIRPAQ